MCSETAGTTPRAEAGAEQQPSHYRGRFRGELHRRLEHEVRLQRRTYALIVASASFTQCHAPRLPVALCQSHRSCKPESFPISVNPRTGLASIVLRITAAVHGSHIYVHTIHTV